MQNNQIAHSCYVAVRIRIPRAPHQLHYNLKLPQTALCYSKNMLTNSYAKTLPYAFIVSWMRLVHYSKKQDDTTTLFWVLLSLLVILSSLSICEYMLGLGGGGREMKGWPLLSTSNGIFFTLMHRAYTRRGFPRDWWRRWWWWCWCSAPAITLMWNLSECKVAH